MTIKFKVKNILNKFKKLSIKPFMVKMMLRKKLKRIIAQWINGEMKGYVFGFEGPPGTGKTSLSQKRYSKVSKR